MKNLLLPVTLGSLVAGVVGATVAITLQTPRSSGAAGGAASANEVAALSDSLAQVARRQGELARAVEDLRLTPTSSLRTPVEDVGQAVERYLAARGSSAAGTADEPAAADAESSAEAAVRRKVEDALASLLDPDLSSDEVQAIWLAMGKADLTDELVAAFEARAEREPNDPEVRVELGQAYLQKIFEVGNGPMAGVWAMKADGAFDAALGLDETHWDARFHKAVALSFWPPAMGKQNAAIEQFEQLVTQQASLPSDPSYAQTYLFLGNMYQQTGQSEKALATWQQGLALYPDNSSLADQVALTSKNP